MGMGQFIGLASAAAANGIDQKAMADMLKLISHVSETYQNTRLKQNEGQMSRFNTLKEIDGRDESNTRQTTQMVQTLMDEKKRLVEELARLLAESLKVKA